MHFGRHLRAAVVAVAICLSTWTAARGAGNFTISLTPDSFSNAPNPAAAIAAFNNAATEWTSQITSVAPINIVIDADFGSLGSGTIAQTNLLGSDIDFDTVRNAIAAHAGPDSLILTALPTSATIRVHTAVPNTFDPTHMYVQPANQKVLGLLSGTNASTDGIITFNSNDPNIKFNYGTTGVANFTNFQTAAAHEIGHVLGFDSTVDDYEANPNQVLDLLPLDLYRFNTASIPTNPADFTTAVRELAPGANTVTSDTVKSYLMSTGTDGNSPSHWKDDALTGNLIGIMDPTIAPGQAYGVSDADLRAMELIGYTLVPEPASIAILIIPGLLLLGRGRREASPP